MSFLGKILIVAQVLGAVAGSLAALRQAWPLTHAAEPSVA